jgi:hypothetical protein
MEMEDSGRGPGSERQGARNRLECLVVTGWQARGTCLGSLMNWVLIGSGLRLATSYQVHVLIHLHDVSLSTGTKNHKSLLC